MKATRMEVVPGKADFFESLKLPRKRLLLSERQVYVELHPTNSGPLASLSKAPVLLAQKLLVTIEPDATCAAGARVEAEIDVDGIEVISSELSRSDADKIKSKLRSHLLHSDAFPRISFQMQDASVQSNGNSVLIRGLLTIHGRALEQFILFKRKHTDVYEANIEILQTAFGLTPLTALMGGLKSDDRLPIHCVVKLS